MKTKIFLSSLIVLLSLSMTSCDNFADNVLDYSKLTGVNWVCYSVDGNTFPTDEAFVVRLENDKELYACSVPNSTGGREWMESYDNNYELQDDVIHLFTDPEAEGTQKDLRLQIMSLNSYSMSYKVLSYTEDGVDMGDTSVYYFRRADGDYLPQLLGVWEGRNTTPGTEFTEFARWEFLEDGFYTYHKRLDDGGWSPQEGDLYYLYGNMLVCVFPMGDSFQCDTWIIRFDGNTLTWFAQRDDKLNTVVMSKVEL